LDNNSPSIWGIPQIYPLFKSPSCEGSNSLKVFFKNLFVNIKLGQEISCVGDHFFSLCKKVPHVWEYNPPSLFFGGVSLFIVCVKTCWGGRDYSKIFPHRIYYKKKPPLKKFWGQNLTVS